MTYVATKMRILFIAIVFCSSFQSLLWLNHVPINNYASFFLPVAASHVLVDTMYKILHIFGSC